jgi:hypothetical protein
LAQHRAELVARANAQRLQLAEYVRQFEGPVHLAEGMVGLANSVRRSPLLLTGLALVLLRTPWRKFARIPKLAWGAWRIWQFVRQWKTCAQVGRLWQEPENRLQ